MKLQNKMFQNELLPFSVKCSSFLIRCFWLIFFCFTLYALVLKSLVHSEEVANQSEYALISSFAVACLFVLIGMFSFSQNQVKQSDYRLKIVYPCMLFFGAFFLRLVIIMLMGFHTNQVSDFGNAYLLSQHSIPLNNDFYKIFSNWAFYSVYLRCIISIFGTSTETVIIWNAILSAASVVLIYFIVILSLHNVSTALGAALIFNFWPAHLFYTIVLSPEFVNIFLVLFAILFFYIGILQRKKKHWIKNLSCVGCAGILFGFSSFFKSVDKIIYIALAVMLILYLLKNWKSSNIERVESLKKAKNESSKFDVTSLLKNGVTAFLVMLLCAFFTIQACFSYLDYYIGSTVNRNPTAHYLYVGLNPYSHGVWAENVCIYTNAVIANNYNYKVADTVVLNQLKKEIQEYHNLNFEFFNNKAKIAWNSSDYLEWPDLTINDKGATAINKTVWLQVFQSYSQFYYLVLSSFLFVGVLFAIKRKEGGILLFSGLFIFGFALVMLFVEVQPRYKCVVYPYMSILSAYGFQCIMERNLIGQEKFKNYLARVKN